MMRLAFLILLQLTSCGKEVAKNDVPAKDYTTKHYEALTFCRQQKYCEDYYFLIDLSIHSGKNRFYIYDFTKKKIVSKNLVTHGSCDAFDVNDAKYSKANFSNRDSSHCSSSGRYKIGKRDHSKWGIKVKYRLHGLDESNSNAQKRVIVLHSWEAVADKEVYPKYSPLSWGCPAVSDNFMRMLDAKLKAAKKPVLLWIID